MSHLKFQGKILPLELDKTIFDYADALKVRVPTSCGRSGECHECIVEIKEGQKSLNKNTDAEKFLQNPSYRLACQAKLTNTDCSVEFEVLRRQPKILTQSSVSRKIPLDKIITKKDKNIIRNNKVLDKFKGCIYGLAIDAGTTTIVMNLIDLETNETVTTASFENPQRFGGSDIMNRISYDTGNFSGELQSVLLSAINFEIGEMAKSQSFHRRQIYDVVIVGNTTMRDILFGINSFSIGQRPYKSLIQTEFEKGLRSTTSINVLAKNLGLRIFPEANVYSGPLIGCHIGTDVTAGLLATGMDQRDEVSMLVDIGTNTEVVVGNKNKMLAASCPAGPAFEGGEITFGMPGYDGAVETFKIEKNSPVIKTINNENVEGICGSGLIDLLAELKKTEIINHLGAFQDPSDKYFFTKSPDMYISAPDISALAQAKSANYCGQWIALREYGVSPADLDNLFLAGGFANYINVENAINIGFIANSPLSKISKVGNTALEGATLMLVSKKMRNIAEDIVKKIQHVELETAPDFFEIFVDGCMFQPMSQNPSTATN